MSVFIINVMEWIVVVGMIHLNRVEYTHLVTGSTEHLAAAPEEFPLWIRDHVAGIQLHDIGFSKEACFTGSGSANDTGM